MADILSIGASATQLYKSALSTVGNNIANLNTEGYTRQVANSAENIPTAQGSMFVGAGARLASVTRAFNAFTESNLRDSSSELGTQEPLIKYADRIVDILGAQNSGLSNAFDKFFASASDLSSDPASTTLRNVFLRDADGLAVRFRDISAELTSIKDETQTAISQQLTSLNELTKQLFNVNEQLEKKATVDEQPPVLLDQRDKLLREMAKLTKIHVNENTSGSVEVRLDSDSGTVVVDKLRTTEFSVNLDDSGQIEILANVYGNPSPTNSLTGGSIGGILNFRNQVLTPAINDLDALAVSTVAEINAIQTTGVDATGLRGTNLFDPDVETLGAAGFALLITNPSKIAAAGLAKITAGATNSGNAKVSYDTVPPGTETPNFVLSYSNANGYSIDGTNIILDDNGRFSFGGINYTILGNASDGDTFTVGLNSNASGDNRNIRQLAKLQTEKVLEGDRSLNDGYLDLVGEVGNASALAKITQGALQVVYDQAAEAKDKVSGVSLDQEAADLIRFQQAFQASAQIIQASSKMFDSILSIR